MKENMAVERQGIINKSITAMDDMNLNWDSVETMVQTCNEKIKKLEQSLNQLTIMDDAKSIIRICTQIMNIRKRLNRRW